MSTLKKQPILISHALDIIVFGSIGIGALIWLTSKLRSSGNNNNNRSIGSSSSGDNSSAAPPKAQPKVERNFVKIMEQQDRRVIFFYGSQTGTAEDYASRLAKECSQKYGVNCMTADIELYDMSYLDTLPQDKLAVFVMATYGEGEPTDNAVSFWDLIMEETVEFSNSPIGGGDEEEDDDQPQQQQPLNQLRYMVFGLGNKTYEHYNAVARLLDQRLSALGAKIVGERGEGDDDGSLEEDFLAWQEKMWPAFCDALGVDESGAGGAAARQPTFAVSVMDEYEADKVYLGELAEWSQQTQMHGAKHPYAASFTSRDLFQDSDRHCLHLEIDLSGAKGLSYQTGDHVAIWPTNNDTEINRLASVLGLSDKLDQVIRIDAIDPAASKKHPFPVPTTYRAAFRHYLDICAPVSRQTLMSLVEYAPTAASQEALRTLATDKDEYHEKVGEAVRNLGEVLELCQDDEGTTAAPGFFESIPFDLVVESLSRLQPRYYSISSSSCTHPTQVAVTAVTLAYQPTPTPNRTVYGVNTNYLWQMHAAQHKDIDTSDIPSYDLKGPRNVLDATRLPVHIRHSQFKLPRNNALPVIMVGPGTGVAPFRGFVHERAALKREGKEVGPTILFYGCRHPKQDFLYADEWPELFDTLGDDSQIITAFSRETEHKVYVQHRLQEHGEQMWQWIEKGAYIYVCGDAKNMARDVQQTFISFAEKYGGKSIEQAQDYVKKLRSTGRYQEDVWS